MHSTGHKTKESPWPQKSACNAKNRPGRSSQGLEWQRKHAGILALAHRAGSAAPLADPRKRVMQKRVYVHDMNSNCVLHCGWIVWLYPACETTCAAELTCSEPVPGAGLDQCLADVWIAAPAHRRRRSPPPARTAHQSWTPDGWMAERAQERQGHPMCVSTPSPSPETAPEPARSCPRHP